MYFWEKGSRHKLPLQPPTPTSALHSFKKKNLPVPLQKTGEKKKEKKTLPHPGTPSSHLFVRAHELYGGLRFFGGLASRAFVDGLAHNWGWWIK